jgi:RNA polymerase sigma-70 factor (ECF subfamily)
MFAAMGIQRGYVQKALDRLPEMFWEVIVLRDIQDLTYVDIAAITGLPMGTVKSRINRGRGRMKSLLRDVYPFSPDRFASAAPG